MSSESNFCATFTKCRQKCKCLLPQGTFLFSIVKYTPLRFSDTYVYPLWANILGWFIATISLSLIPLYAMHKMARGEGTLRQVSQIPNMCTSVHLFCPHVKMR